MRHPATVGVKDRIGAGEARGDVVGVEDGVLTRFFHALTAHHADVHPTDRQDASRTPGGRRYGAVGDS